MTARGQLKKISGHESEEAWRQYELIGINCQLKSNFDFV
jgi:hypothetical protein